jgi:hypothetical protein
MDGGDEEIIAVLLLDRFEAAVRRSVTPQLAGIDTGAGGAVEDGTQSNQVADYYQTSSDADAGEF